jgi:deoxyadenosine/deoxycytidine kinase
MSQIEPSKNMIKNGLIVEVCGGIASGKTTFASLMKRNNLNIIYEDFKKNPFWEAFYRNPGKYIFETEITFILQHYHQIKGGIESGKNFICDFSFLLDLAYAKIGLTGTKLKAFECVYDELRNEIDSPYLIVYLKCDAETELNRIRERDRAEENTINLEFLSDLNKALYGEIQKIQDTTPVITINSSEKDFANIESVKGEMVNLIDNYLSKV